MALIESVHLATADVDVAMTLAFIPTRTLAVATHNSVSIRRKLIRQEEGKTNDIPVEVGCHWIYLLPIPPSRGVYWEEMESPNELKMRLVNLKIKRLVGHYSLKRDLIPPNELKMRLVNLKKKD